MPQISLFGDSGTDPAPKQKSLKPKSEPRSIGQFKANIEQEFCQGSAIASDLFQETIEFVQDTEPLPGGEVHYPIHEALNWDRVVRFGRQARANQFAAIFRNENGSAWQAKLSEGIEQGSKSYCAPKGNGSRAFLPPVPASLQAKIGKELSIEIPTDESFWGWLERNPQIPIVWTEGGKKALSLLSCGAIAIALYGCNGGYRSKDALGNAINPELIADVARFCQPGRRHYLAFDQDESQKTRKRVSIAVSRFGELLAKSGGKVFVTTWSGSLGKGVDDLIVNQGVAAWEEAYQDALSLEHWQIWQRLEGRLTYESTLEVETKDLSTLELKDIPVSGVIGIWAGKGTGKSKVISRFTEGLERVLAGGHRIALMRNLSVRLGLDYLGDVDKANGQFLNGSSYTLRLGFCVDSLLSLDPNKFAGCDLVLDEVVQVVRHLLTSSTCAKEGKRPVLLSRFKELIRVARRVIIADADLDNDTLNYIQELRGDGQPVFLIRNTYQSSGYPVRMIESRDRTVIVGDFIKAVNALKPGEKLFITTDSKSMTKQLMRLLRHECPEKAERILLVNSDTSGGEQEREFIQTPDQVIANGAFDIFICSPSVATGVSIEIQGQFVAVYGIFVGVSSTDADVAQALGRVREPVPRVVWCAKRGSNFSKVSRSTNHREVRTHLQQQTSTTVRLVRSSLREDLAGEINEYDWNTSPHMNLYCRIMASQNQSMHSFRDSVLVRLKYEGNPVTVESRASDPVVKNVLKAIRSEQLESDAREILSAEDMTFMEVSALEQRENQSPEERLAISKFYAKDFYALDALTLADILWDNEGRRRSEILNLEAQLHPDIAVERTIKGIEKQATWNKGLCPWDISMVELRRHVRDMFWVNELIQKMENGWKWTKYDLKWYADKARAAALQIKIALNFTISDKVSDTQIIHQLLLQLGVKIAKPVWSRSVEGHEGEKLRVFSLDFDHWNQLKAVLERRQAKRLTSASSLGDSVGSPSEFKLIKPGGDPLELSSALAALGQPETVVAIGVNWFSPENLEGIREIVEGLEDEPSALAQYLQAVPQEVLTYLGIAS